MPEASVIRGPQALSGFIGRKGSCRRFDKFLLKYLMLNLRKSKNTIEIEFSLGELELKEE